MRLLLVEDDPTLRAQLRAGLNDAGYVVDEADNGRDGHHLGASEAFDAVILDLGLPLVDGITVLKRWREAGLAVPVLILTARDGWHEKVAGIDAGADDYLAKPFDPDELLLRIRAILRRAPPPVTPGPDVIGFGPFRFAIGREELTRNGVVIKLTTAEAGLLKALAERADRSVSREELVAKARVDGGERTIDVQVTRLRRKLEDDPKNPRWLQTVRGAGYILRSD